MELFSVCMQDAEIEDDEKVKIPEKHHKKTFGHHSGKTGLPFCTIEGMGQVSIGNRHRTTFISKHRLVREKPIRCPAPTSSLDSDVTRGWAAMHLQLESYNCALRRQRESAIRWRLFIQCGAFCIL